MRPLRTYLLVLFATLASVANAQLSPGDLTEAHKHLEGMGNCTKCHDLGNKVTNALCLACHKEIDNLMDLNRGYHSSEEVKNKDCTVCHSEHHGRKFDMMRFDQDNFDHDLTGYVLEGGHKPIDCRECHKPDYIEDRSIFLETPDIAKLEKTFLGLQEACLTCHDDYHQKTLDNDCIQCHNFEEWRPAPGFDHDNTEYPLEGKHVDVECVKCHKETIRNGLDFQQFSDVPFADCIDCHEDVHEGRLAGACNNCHTVEGFEIFKAKRTFNHNTTKFPLNGAHKTTDCYACHEKASEPSLVFQDQLGVGVNDCATCHDDVHEGRYGSDCAQCHQETSFFDLRTLDFFDHDQTDYPLEGKHVDVDCKECHTAERYSEPIDFSA